MPYKSSNIPKKMFYSAISAEILKIGKATTSFKDFSESTSILITRISKLLNSHKECFLKFIKSNDYIVKQVL